MTVGLDLGWPIQGAKVSAQIEVPSDATGARAPRVSTPPVKKNVCHRAFCIIYGMGQGGLSYKTFAKWIRERDGPPNHPPSGTTTNSHVEQM